MSLNFAAFTPHPPIIIPEIGRDNLAVAKKTVSAMKKLAKKFNDAEIDSIVIISPHAELRSYAMTVSAPNDFRGDFSDFGAGEIWMEFSSDDQLAERIYQFALDSDIPTEIETKGSFLDHGAMVPLYYLNSSGRKINLVEIAYSALPRAEHLEFGRVIGSVIEKEKKHIALVASGDLSHRIFDNDYNEYGKEFDKKLANLIKNGRLRGVSMIDEELVELAGECGYRSLLILAGVLNDRKIKSELLSYEAPFGVGYLVANFKL